MSEVLIMKRLGEKTCPYIVQLIRAWQEDQYFYMQINLAERGTVKDLLLDLATRGAGDYFLILLLLRIHILLLLSFLHIYIYTTLVDLLCHTMLMDAGGCGAVSLPRQYGVSYLTLP